MANRCKFGHGNCGSARAAKGTASGSNLMAVAGLMRICGPQRKRTQCSTERSEWEGRASRLMRRLSRCRLWEPVIVDDDGTASPVSRQWHAEKAMEANLGGRVVSSAKLVALPISPRRRDETAGDASCGVGWAHSIDSTTLTERKGPYLRAGPFRAHGGGHCLRERARRPLAHMESLESLQSGLYHASKAQRARRFHSLHDKICRTDFLREAWRRVKENKGAAGVDRQTIEDIEVNGEERSLTDLQHELQSKTYRVQCVRRVFIPKRKGGIRPLGIPTIKDRVVQQAVRLVTEPIFEADFQPFSYGYRPNKSTKQDSLEIYVAQLWPGHLRRPRHRRLLRPRQP